MTCRPYGHSKRPISKRVDVACCFREVDEPLISLTTRRFAAIHLTCSTLPAHLGMCTSVRRPGASAARNRRYNNPRRPRRLLDCHLLVNNVNLNVKFNDFSSSFSIKTTHHSYIRTIIYIRKIPCF